MTWLPTLLAALAASAWAAHTVMDRYQSPVRVHRRSLRQTQRWSITDCPEGSRARIVGTVRLHHGEIVRSPLTGSLCVAWVLRVYRKTYARRTAQIDLIHEDAVSVPFTVEDRTGAALVGAERAPPDLAVDHADMADSLGTPSWQVQQFLRQHPSMTPLPSTALIFEEARLEAGDALAVIGIGSWKADETAGRSAGHGYRDAPDSGKRLVIENAQLSDHVSCTS